MIGEGLMCFFSGELVYMRRSFKCSGDAFYMCLLTQVPSFCSKALEPNVREIYMYLCMVW